jgi:nucleotide-binding universal stress UspA family protein
MSIFPTVVLVATDGSEEASRAREVTVELCAKTGSELHLVHVYDVAPIYPLYPEATEFGGVEMQDPVLEEELESVTEQRARNVLEAEAEEVRSAGGKLAQVHLREGGVPHEIVALAEDTGAGLIVMGSRGHGGIRRALMGSVSDAVMRHAHCPVLVVRDQEEGHA